MGTKLFCFIPRDIEPKQSETGRVSLYIEPTSREVKWFHVISDKFQVKPVRYHLVPIWIHLVPTQFFAVFGRGQVSSEVLMSLFAEENG